MSLIVLSTMGQVIIASKYAPLQKYFGHEISPSFTFFFFLESFSTLFFPLQFSPNNFKCFTQTDKHLHDAHVELRQRSPGSVHVRIRGEVPPVLDQRSPGVRPAPAAGCQVLPAEARRAEPTVGGES